MISPSQLSNSQNLGELVRPFTNQRGHPRGTSGRHPRGRVVCPRGAPRRRGGAERGPRRDANVPGAAAAGGVAVASGGGTPRARKRLGPTRRRTIRHTRAIAGARRAPGRQATRRRGRRRDRRRRCGAAARLYHAAAGRTRLAHLVDATEPRGPDCRARPGRRSPTPRPRRRCRCPRRRPCRRCAACSARLCARARPAAPPGTTGVRRFGGGRTAVLPVVGPLRTSPSLSVVAQAPVSQRRRRVAPSCRVPRRWRCSARQRRRRCGPVRAPYARRHLRWDTATPLVDAHARRRLSAPSAQHAAGARAALSATPHVN